MWFVNVVRILTFFNETDSHWSNDHVVLRRVISTPGGEVRPLQGSHFALGQGAVTGGAPTAGCYDSQNLDNPFHIFMIKPNCPQY